MALDTLPDRFAAVCARNADRLAIIDGHERLTFADVAAAVERFAGHLRLLGVRPGEVVTWQLPNWWEAAVVHHGILRAGAIPNPVSPALQGEALFHVVREARPVLLIAPETWRGVDVVAGSKLLRDTVGLRVMVVRGQACTTLTFEQLLVEPADAPAPTGSADDLAVLLYTSGTTAMPKGVQHSHRGLLAEIESFTSMHELTQQDRYLGGAPVTHIAGLAYGLLAPFVLGTSTTLLERWEPARALAAIERDRATFMTGPPTLLHTLAIEPAIERTDVSSFRLFSTGGASISAEQIRAAAARLGCVVKRAYGSTEMPTLTATTPSDDDHARLETDGRVVGSAEVRIVLADGNEAAVEQDGEIWARGPELFVGYRSGEPSLTEDGWFRTGDIGRIDHRGLLRVTGRLKDIIIRGGENVSAAEVEDLLLQHPEVADVAVIGIPDERLGETVCAVVVAGPERTRPTLEQLKAFMRARSAAPYKLPESVMYLDALPRTESGKVRKEELRRLVTATDGPSPAAL